MTGFAERSFDSPTLRAKIAIKSINHRFLDWNYKGAPLGEMENRLRNLCQKKLHRGRIEATLELTFSDPECWELSINEGLITKIITALEEISSKTGKTMSFSLDNLLRLSPVVEIKSKEFSPQEISFLERSFGRVLDEMIKERRKEGRVIGREIKGHVRILKKTIQRIERLSKKQPFLLRKKIRQRLRELDEVKPLSKERFEEEVAYLVQRSDISEEIARIKSHLISIEKLLQPQKEEPAGKMLDFLAQELSREANTLNAKSQDLEIVKLGLTLKGEIEAIRQLVQNVE